MGPSRRGKSADREQQARLIVTKALKAIAKETPKLGTAWVLPHEVRRDVEAWLLLFPEKKLAQLAKSSIYTIRAWGRGSHRVRKSKWDSIRRRVTAEIEKRESRRVRK
jgi:hypothetical protein